MSAILNTISSVSHAIYSACFKDLDDKMYRPYTPDLKKKGVEIKDVPLKARRPTVYDLVNVFLFQQTWGSTAMGFGGAGGCAITTGNVVVVIGPNYDACVYFSERLAYHIKRPNDKFREDVVRHCMSDVSTARKKYEKE